MFQYNLFTLMSQPQHKTNLIYFAQITFPLSTKKFCFFFLLLFLLVKWIVIFMDCYFFLSFIVSAISKCI